MPRKAEAEATVPDCATTEGCPAAGRGHWLRHVDKNGERSTVTEPDGNVWNRACPVDGCTRRVFG